MRQTSKTEEIEMIDQIPLFEKLSEETLSTLQQQIRQRKLAKSEHLFSPGDDSDSMYLVQSGRIRIWTVSAAGAEITLNVLTPGTVFGEIGLLDGSERTAGASALDAVELMSISRAAFDNALDRDPQLARNVIAFLCERLRWISARLEDSALRSAPERLARMLVHLCNDYGVDSAEGIHLSINLTQGELARWTQMSRESLNKTLNRWADEGLLAQSRGKITVKDRDRLEDIAEFGEEE
ncbi:MAG: Crp/Fnr family transcriptional regulator [Pseudomonadota bacterium]